MKKDRVLSYLVFGMFVVLCLSLFINYKQYRDAKDRPDKVEVRIDTIYTEKTDTAPHQVSESHVGFVSVPVKNVSDNEGEISSDTANVSDDSLEIVGDSVMIPITQKVYEDSAYTAYVSGYRQNLDSITIRQRDVVTTIRETYTETVECRTHGWLRLRHTQQEPRFLRGCRSYVQPLPEQEKEQGQATTAVAFL